MLIGQQAGRKDRRKGPGRPADFSFLCISDDGVAEPRVAFEYALWLLVAETEFAEKDGVALLELPEGLVPADLPGRLRIDVGRVDHVVTAHRPTRNIGQVIGELETADQNRFTGGQRPNLVDQAFVEIAPVLPILRRIVGRKLVLCVSGRLIEQLEEGDDWFFAVVPRHHPPECSDLASAGLVKVAENGVTQPHVLLIRRKPDRVEIYDHVELVPPGPGDGLIDRWQGAVGAVAAPHRRMDGQADHACAPGPGGVKQGLVPPPDVRVFAHGQPNRVPQRQAPEHDLAALSVDDHVSLRSKNLWVMGFLAEALGRKPKEGRDQGKKKDGMDQGRPLNPGLVIHVATDPGSRHR